MPNIIKQKKKPFGKSSLNEDNRRNVAPSRPGKENELQKPTSSADSPRRRDSKTPKASNLTTIGGAYGLADEFPELNPTRKKKKPHAKSKQKLLERRDASRRKPDPSPLKKPDPTATKLHSLSLQNQSKKKRSVKSVVSSATKKYDVKKATAGEVVNLTNPSTNDSLSSMDTGNSTPEKYSPLITSPHNKPDPPVQSVAVAAAVAKKQSEKAATLDKNIVGEKSVRLVREQSGDKHIQRDSNQIKLTAPMAPSKKRVGNDDEINPNSAASRKGNRVDETNVLNAMMNSCKDGAEESGVVGSFVGGASLQRSRSDDMSEMTMMDDNASNASMTTLGDYPALDRYETKRNAKLVVAPPRLNDVPRPRADPIIPRHANLIDEETIASHITNQLKHANKSQLQQNDDTKSQNTITYLPGGWELRISKSKNRPFWKHPDLGTTWHNPGISIPNNTKESGQNVSIDQPKDGGTAEDNRADDANKEKELSSHETLEELEATKNNEDEMLQENEIDVNSAMSQHTTKEPDPSLLNTKLDPSATASSHESKTSVTLSQRRISEGYQKLLAPYQSIEKSVASKTLSVASSRNSGATSPGDISSQCLTQEFTIAEQAEEVGDGTPSIGNSDGSLARDNDSHVFDTAQDDLDMEDEDDLLNTQQDGDLNSLASDHVDVAALLSQRKNNSPMSTIRESLNESAADPSPSSANFSTGVDHDESMSHEGSDDEKSLVRDSVSSGRSNGSEDEGNSLSSHQTFSKSAIKEANKAEEEEDEEISDEDKSQFDDDSGGQSPVFESTNYQEDDDDVSDTDSTEDEVADSQRQSRRRATLPFDASNESIGELSDFKKKKFFPPGPLCSLQFLDEIEEDVFDTPLWRRMKRKRSSLTSVKREKAAYKAEKLRQSH